MTKPKVVEKVESVPGVVRTDTEIWKRGPGAEPNTDAATPAPSQPTPELEIPEG